MRASAIMFVLFVAITAGALSGCGAQRRMMVNSTRPYCEVAELTDAETGMRTNYVWHATCQDGRQLRCGGTAAVGSIQNVHCEPEGQVAGALPAVQPAQAMQPAQPAVAPQPEQAAVESTAGAAQATTAPPAAPTPTPAAVDPCAGIECSGHGRCVPVNGAPVCACEAGFAPDPAGINCIAAGAQ